jgi:hypothetical protein
VDIQIAQLLIGFLLFMVLTFGIGFILNMLLKTTWIPAYIYLALAIYFYGFYQSGKFVETGREYAFVDYSIGLAGLLGALISGWTIKILRERGFRMF